MDCAKQPVQRDRLPAAKAPRDRPSEREVTLNERLEPVVVNILMVLTGLAQALTIALIALGFSLRVCVTILNGLSSIMKPRRRRG
jgi:hypothetical protein